MLGAISYAKKTGVGLVRMNNEDNLHIDEHGLMFCVADGMGGGEEGETASRIVCEEVAKVDLNEDFVARLEHLEMAIAKADHRIREIVKVSGYEQMGSTFVGLVFSHVEPARAALHYIGDSRAYRLRAGEIMQLTRDHTVAGGGDRSNPLAHLLTRAIGTGPFKPGDWRIIDLQAGDKLIICSDGVHDVISDTLLRDLLGATDDLEIINEYLEKYILRLGAPDNYTYIIVDVGEVTNPAGK